jgi:multiple sugar transport system permease protein
MSLKLQRNLGKMFTITSLALGLGIVLIPFWYMIITSFKPQTMIFELPPHLWPRTWTLNNYIAALGKDQFGRYFLNSAFVALAATFLTVIISSMTAYVFARLHFRGKEPLFYLFLMGMMVPPVMLIIPQFMVAKWLNLFNYSGLILVYITMNISMQTFLLRGVFESVPRDLEEAALIDGSGNWTIFTRIILPLSIPGIAVVIINTFLYSWEEFAWANVAIKNTNMRTLPIGIALFQSEHLTEWGQVFAASLVALIPVVIIFIIFQRYFIQGISTTGLKG